MVLVSLNSQVEFLETEVHTYWFYRGSVKYSPPSKKEKKSSSISPSSQAHAALLSHYRSPTWADIHSTPTGHHILIQNKNQLYLYRRMYKVELRCNWDQKKHIIFTINPNKFLTMKTRSCDSCFSIWFVSCSHNMLKR